MWTRRMACGRYVPSCSASDSSQSASGSCRCECFAPSRGPRPPPLASPPPVGTPPTDSVRQTPCQTVGTIFLLPLPCSRAVNMRTVQTHGFDPSPNASDLSGLLSQRHCRRLVLPGAWSFVIHLPGALRSTGVTRLPRYYGSSDSCPTPSSRTGLSASWIWPSDHSASNHLVAPPIAFARYPSASTASGSLRSGLRHWQQARQTTRPNRVHFRCGLAVRLPMLPTPPRGDAVSFGYRPENVYLKRTCTPLS